jgi:hypothetical protein
MRATQRGGSSKGSLKTKILFIISLSSLIGAALCRAQDAFAQDRRVLGTAIISQPPAADSAATGPPQTDPTSADNQWHFAVAPYLWFPGVHGTAVDSNGGSLSFRASPGDLLSNFHFGLMGGAEVSRKRLILTGDLLWIKLEDDNATPLPTLGATTATIKATEFFLTPKVGFRLVNHEKIKVDASTGFRYWHLGENLRFNPSRLGRDFSGSQDFVDPLVGGRIGVFLSPRIIVNILGDVGGWGSGSQLEYQWAGLVGYRMNARWALHVGYRYLYVDKRDDADFKATTAGVMLGITLDLK